VVREAPASSTAAATRWSRGLPLVGQVCPSPEAHSGADLSVIVSKRIEDSGVILITAKERAWNH
jgi:hypothetical protein